jgi:hypothetical protein
VNLDRWPAQLAFLVLAFAVPTLIALAAGAANLGTAATFGQLAFAAGFMWLIVRRSPDAPAPADPPRTGRAGRSARS